MFLLRRVGDLMARPGKTWQEIKAERTTATRLIAGYVGVLAVFAVIERIAIEWFRLAGLDTEPAALRTTLWRSFWGSVPFLAVDLLNVYLAGRIANSLYPPPADEPDRGFRIAAYASTPLWLGRIIVPFDLPFIEWAALAAVLYAPYLLYRGMAVVLDLPPGRAAKGAAVLVLAAAVIVGIVNYIVYLFVVL
jgi:hypothetical protein